MSALRARQQQERIDGFVARLLDLPDATTIRRLPPAGPSWGQFVRYSWSWTRSVPSSVAQDHRIDGHHLVAAMPLMLAACRSD